VCPVEEKAKIDICESDQWVADFDSANFGLKRLMTITGIDMVSGLYQVPMTATHWGIPRRGV